MITLAQAKALKPGDVLHFELRQNADGTCERWRVNGRVQTWKRDPDRIRIPVKHGLRDYDALDKHGLSFVHLEAKCSREK